MNYGYFLNILGCVYFNFINCLKSDGCQFFDDKL